MNRPLLREPNSTRYS
uniref:Uncharacterized protein n=1 Tax=Arundo donax TaxID=35708 RepID=A0A0A9GLT5_ARUDO